MASTITMTTAAAFLTEVWAPAVTGYLDDLVDLSEFGTDYSNLANNKVVHIPSTAGFTAVTKTAGSDLSAQTNTTTDNQLNLSNRVAVYYVIEDLSKIAEPGFLDHYVQDAAAAIQKKINDLIASTVQADTTNTVITLAADDTITDAEFRSGIKSLLESDVHIANETVFACNPTMYTGSILSLSTFNTYQITGAKQMGEGLKGYEISLYPSNEWSDGGTNVSASMWHRSALALGKTPVNTLIAPAPESTGYKVSLWVDFGALALHGSRIQNFQNP